MARQTAINTADDMRWLREVHLPRLPSKYKSAVITGNEDYPDRIEVYERRDPRVTDVPAVFKADDAGVFRETTRAHHATKKTTSKKSPAQLNREIVEALAQPKAGKRAHATMKVPSEAAHAEQLDRQIAPRLGKTRAEIVRRINSIVRASDGRNVYLIRERLGEHEVRRVTRARTKGRGMEVYLLDSGRWLGVMPELGDRIDVR